jgi:hypothetical protein
VPAAGCPLIVLWKKPYFFSLCIKLKMKYLFIYYRSILIDVGYGLYTGNGIFKLIYHAYVS